MCRIVAAMILVLIVGLLTGNFDRGKPCDFSGRGTGRRYRGGDRAGGISFLTAAVPVGGKSVNMC